MDGAATTAFPRPWVTTAIIAAWAAACVGGLVAMAIHGSTPGVAAPAAAWPAASRLARSATGDTLLVVVHPKCPCSRATIDNLAVLMAHCPPGRMAATVLFVRPAGAAAGWERTDLWAAAVAIPGVAVVVDEDGREAALFGARTSGQAMVFDPAGRELFAGGLTVGRGHAGDSGGTAAVRAIAAGDQPAVARTPVFGCPLQSSAGAVPTFIGGPSCRR